MLFGREESIYLDTISVDRNVVFDIPLDQF